jgi:tetratricopeptide (TPR) repeat protein
LLRYVVERTLSGDEGAIKAYSIAVDVFGRPQSFDPQSDPIVRVQARRLRTLLEQYYDTGKSESAVQIHLPLGRYVPEFSFAHRPVAAIVAGGGPATVASTPREVVHRPVGTWNRFWLNALLAFCFMIIGVGLVVFLLRWTFPPSPSTSTGSVPDFPTVTVGAFDNLTGQAVLDDDVAAMAQKVESDLGKFELLRVVPNGGKFALRATVQENEGQFTLKAMLSQNGSDGIVWSTTITPPKGTDTDVLTDAATSLSAVLGSATGPLHAADRAWLSQLSSPPPPSLYACALEYLAWRDIRKRDVAATAADCLRSVLAASPNDATALAEDAGLRAWIAQYEAPAGADLVQLLADEVTEAGRAVSLMPNSSFAYQQQALVLMRQGLLDAARGPIKRSTELNPASMDALVVYGLLQWLNGDFTEGVASVERAIASVPSPPAYYYMTRAFDALRQRRFYDAIDAAQALAAGDEELGPTIALAAAPVIGRNDLIDRYRPVVLGNQHFQAVGIMTRIQRIYKVPALTDRMREGLILAGIPPAVLDAPFNADGTLKKLP